MDSQPTPDVKTRFNTQQNIAGRVEVLQAEFENHAKQVSSFMDRQEKINTDLFSLIRSQGDALVDKLSRVGAEMHNKFDAFQSSLHNRGKITAPAVAVVVSMLTMLGGIVHWYVSDQTRSIESKVQHQQESSAAAFTRLRDDDMDTKKVSDLLREKLEQERIQNATERARMEERMAFMQEQLKELRTSTSTPKVSQ